MTIDGNERLEKDYLNWAPGAIMQLNLDINRILVYKNYAIVRDYVDRVENLIERAWKIMEKYPELKSPRIEKFLEESLREARASLDSCKSIDEKASYYGSRWEDHREWYYKPRIYYHESYGEMQARWTFQDRLRYDRLGQEPHQAPWFNY